MTKQTEIRVVLETMISDNPYHKNIKSVTLTPVKNLRGEVHRMLFTAYHSSYTFRADLRGPIGPGRGRADCSLYMEAAWHHDPCNVKRIADRRLIEAFRRLASSNIEGGTVEL